jgi:hypothetical protein
VLCNKHKLLTLCNHFGSHSVFFYDVRVDHHFSFLCWLLIVYKALAVLLIIYKPLAVLLIVYKTLAVLLSLQNTRCVTHSLQNTRCVTHSLQNTHVEVIAGHFLRSSPGTS